MKAYLASLLALSAAVATTACGGGSETASPCHR